MTECAWCGAEISEKFPNRRGEVFCSTSHRSSSNRALKRLTDSEVWVPCNYRDELIRACAEIDLMNPIVDAARRVCFGNNINAFEDLKNALNAYDKVYEQSSQ